MADGIRKELVVILNLLIKNKKGLTLVEIIVAIAILGIVSVTLISVLTTGFVNIVMSGERDRAMSVASNIMEELYANQPLDLSHGEHTDVKDYILEEYLKESTFYEYDFELEDVTTISEESYQGFEILVKVFYNDGNRHVRLRSFVRGVQNDGQASIWQ